jgi:hypothetical protein
MKKLSQLLKTIDDNLFHWTFIAFIVAVSLLPKFPLQHVEYTYIKIRIDDLLPVILCLVFFIQWARRKLQLRTKFFWNVMFWAAVFISFAFGYYYLHTIREPVLMRLLHNLRRVQYDRLFCGNVCRHKRVHFKTYLKTYFIALLIYSIVGQNSP